jgi:leader peptidase (prepilin peptidase) / N-methyltransferase
VNVSPDWLIVLLAAVVGASIGSFLNVCIYRWPEDLSVIRPPSRCPACGTELAWRDNVPVLGWILLRGRCRYCGVRVSVQYPLIEFATAMIWVAAVVQYGPEVEALRFAIFLSILLGIAMTDARAMVIPDQFTLVGAAIGLLLAAFPGGMPFTSALLGAAAGYVLLWIVKLMAEKALGKPALGIGDIHMMLFVGAFTGTAGMLLTLMLGSVLGIIIGVPLTALRGRLRPMGTYLPLGTFLALGAVVSYIWGPAMVGWYLDFLGV